jgi:hypothetical protein
LKIELLINPFPIHADRDSLSIGSRESVISQSRSAAGLLDHPANPSLCSSRASWQQQNDGRSTTGGKEAAASNKEHWQLFAVTLHRVSGFYLIEVQSPLFSLFASPCFSLLFSVFSASFSLLPTRALPSFTLLHLLACHSVTLPLLLTALPFFFLPFVTPIP